MERETGLEPATSSLGSWHSTTELLPRFGQPATSRVLNNLSEPGRVSKVSPGHCFSPVRSKNGHQNGHQTQPENLTFAPGSWCPPWCPFSDPKKGPNLPRQRRFVVCPPNLRSSGTSGILQRRLTRCQYLAAVFKTDG